MRCVDFLQTSTLNGDPGKIFTNNTSLVKRESTRGFKSHNKMSNIPGI